MTIRVNEDRMFVILEPMVTEMTIDGPAGKKMKIPIPEAHSERSRIGVVQKVGEKVTRYKPGDSVLLSTYAGVRIHLIDKEIDGQKIDEDRFRIVREEEVLATLEN